MRPIGGMMMGYVGDKYGRKKALEISIFLMAFPTFAMGCLPSYDAVGILAPILLTITRLLQGLSVGGQMMSSLVFTVESRPRKKWGLYGSYVMAAANTGTLLGGVVGNYIRNTFSEDALISYGWRIPFWMGLLVSISGIYLRLYGNEPMLHSSPESGPTENPIILAFQKENRRSLLSATLVPTLWSGGFYLTFVWMVIYMLDLSDNPVPHGFVINNIALLLTVVIGFPPAGILSDVFGRIKVMTVGGIGMLICSPVLVHVIGTGDPVKAFFSQCTLGVFLSLYCSPMMAWLAESFRPELRLTAVSIGYNIAQALVGGSYPSIATLMSGSSLGNSSPGFLLSGAAILGLTGLYIAEPPPEYRIVTNVTAGSLVQAGVTDENKEKNDEEANTSWGEIS